MYCFVFPRRLRACVTARWNEEKAKQALTNTLCWQLANDSLAEHPKDSSGNYLPRQQALAYCTAPSYELERLSAQLRDAHYRPAYIARDVLQCSVDEGRGYAFFFREGVAVFWGSTPETESELLELVERSSTEASYKRVEVERMYYYLGDLETTGVKDGNMHVQAAGKDATDVAAQLQRLLALSYGLSRSVKLAVLENQVDQVIAKTRDLPDELISPWYVRLFTNRRREVRHRLHDVVKLRGVVNLHTELLEPPDTYWDVPDLERAYESIVKELDIIGRVDLVNRRLDYTNQLVFFLDCFRI